MIRRFRHRGLKRLFEDDDRRGLSAQQVEKIRRVLARLNRSSEPAHMDLPGWRLHPLKGELAGFWSVTISANWRIVFRFENGEAIDVDYLQVRDSALGPAPAYGAGRLLVAARLGKTRLLDNVAIEIGTTVGADGRVPAVSTDSLESSWRN